MTKVPGVLKSLGQVVRRKQRSKNQAPINSVEDLFNLINKSDHAIIDLHNMTVRTDRHLCIHRSNLTIQNGTLEIRGGIVISPKSSSITLLNLNITSLATAIEAQGPKLVIRQCIISSLAGAGLVAEGQKVSGTVEQTQLTGLDKGGVMVQAGADLSMTDVTISDVHDFAGVLVAGANSKLLLKGCTINECKEQCLHADEGGVVVASDSEVMNSKEKQGVVCTGMNSLVELTGCKVHDCNRSCVWATSSATINIDACQLWGSKVFSGLVVGKSSSARVANSVIDRCWQSCAYAVKGGTITVKNCNFSGSTDLPGLFSHGQGSVINAYDTKVSDCAKPCVCALGGEVTVDACEIWNCQYQCILAQGTGSRVTVRKCEVHDSILSSVLALEGGQADVFGCEVWGSQKHPCVAAEGKGSVVKVQQSIVCECPRPFVSSTKDATAEVIDCALGGKRVAAKKKLQKGKSVSRVN